MKRLLVILLALLLAAAVAAAVFIATFDADRWRPRVTAELSRALGKPVSIQRLSLSWQRGLALELRGVAVQDDAQGWTEPLLAAEAVNALVKLGPLLHRSLVVSSVVVTRPRVRISRNPRGEVQVAGLAAAAAPAAAPAAASDTVSFTIASFRIEDGEVRWVDAMTAPPHEIRLRHVDAALSDISPGRPMRIEVHAALEAERPNVHISGRLTPPAAHRPGVGAVRPAGTPQ
jgi:uncharacterized protein involved in outer membrane biogenesis